MKSLVTGASGYIGKNLVKLLVKNGIEVRAFVRKTSNIKPLLNLKNVEIFYGDVTDTSSLENAIKGCDYVFHLAALVYDWGKYEKFYRVNYLGTENVLKAALKANIKKFIHISTLGVLDLRGKKIVREDCPYGHFTSAYCKTKAKAEMLVKEYNKYFPVVILRPGAVYGPEDPMCTLRTLNYAKRNLLFLIDKGKGIFPHVYIDNLNEAIFLAFQSDKAINETFNILDDSLATCHEFFNYFNKIAGKGEIKISLPYSVAWSLALIMDTIAKITGIPPLLSWTSLEFLTLKCKFDISKAKKLLGYNPRISLEEGMKRVESWWKRINSRFDA